MRSACLVDDGRNARFRGLTAQAALGPLPRDDDAGAEMNREFPDFRVRDIGTDLRQVRAPVRRRMQIDERITVNEHFRKHLVRDQPCHAAACAAGKRPVEVATVGQVAVARSYALRVDRGQRNHGASQRAGVDVREGTSRYFDAVQLVAVHPGRHA